MYQVQNVLSANSFQIIFKITRLIWSYWSLVLKDKHLSLTSSTITTRQVTVFSECSLHDIIGYCGFLHMVLCMQQSVTCNIFPDVYKIRRQRWTELLSKFCFKRIKLKKNYPHKGETNLKLFLKNIQRKYKKL